MTGYSKELLEAAGPPIFVLEWINPRGRWWYRPPQTVPGSLWAAAPATAVPGDPLDGSRGRPLEVIVRYS